MFYLLSFFHYTRKRSQVSILIAFNVQIAVLARSDLAVSLPRNKFLFYSRIISSSRHFSTNAPKNLVTNKPRPWPTRKDHQVTLPGLPALCYMIIAVIPQANLPFVIVAEPHLPARSCTPLVNRVRRTHYTPTVPRSHCPKVEYLMHTRAKMCILATWKKKGKKKATIRACVYSP